MKLADLKFDYPEELVALEPARPTRVMWVDLTLNEKLVDASINSPEEISMQQLIDRIPAGDAFVINDTQVLKRRVFTKNDELEILFLDKKNETDFFVLFPSKKIKVGEEIILPLGHKMTLLEKGLPQLVRVEPALTETDFNQMAELPLPPYIQKARATRHNVVADESWYQTAWAKKPGSFAAPTASLHFSEADLKTLSDKGVHVLKITLHVGLGTFLPVKVEDLDQHIMHAEVYSVSENVWKTLSEVRERNHKIWALGTTVTRTLETVARTGSLCGESQLLLQPGSEFKMVDRLLTNFHQPESTLLALVAGFSNLNIVKHNYSWAIQHKFKLFSYGDLSVWVK